MKHLLFTVFGHLFPFLYAISLVMLMPLVRRDNTITLRSYPITLLHFCACQLSLLTGLYTGLLAASFCAAQFISSWMWGSVADRWGRYLLLSNTFVSSFHNWMSQLLLPNRRPALLAGVLGSGCSMLVFGFSSSYPMAMCSRFTAGFLNGNLGIVKVFSLCLLVVASLRICGPVSI
jgi:MFS family permease